MSIILASTSDKLQVVTSGAVTTDVHASFMDYNGTVSTPGRKNTLISTATTTDVTGSPASSEYRNIKVLDIRNRDSASSVDVTVKHTDGTNSPELKKVTLAAGETLNYDESAGWRVFDAAGQTKTVYSTGVVSVARLSADQSNSTTTPTEVTGLSVTVAPGTYMFQYNILYQSSATTTGVKFSVNHSGTVSAFVYNWQVVDNTATAATAAADQDAVAATGQVYSVFAARAKSTAGTGTTISVDTQNADMFAIVEGLAIVTASGSLQLWHGSETAAATTIKAGSSLLLVKTA